MCHGQVRKVVSSLKEKGVWWTFLTVIDVVIARFVNVLRDRLYRWKSDSFGVWEALFWSKGVDRWQRYSCALKHLLFLLTSGRRFRLLEVGAGGSGIAGFLQYRGDLEGNMIVLSDLREGAIRGTTVVSDGLSTVVADGCHLPFCDDAFDAVVCIDTLEHIESDERRRCIEELKRVSGGFVLLHLPVQTADRVYVGRDSDREFQAAFLKRFGREEQNTAEHLRAGHWDLRDIVRCLPDARVEATQSANVWIKHMVMSRRPVLGHLTGLAYLLVWKRRERRRPYRSCCVMWKKRTLQIHPSRPWKHAPAAH